MYKFKDRHYYETKKRLDHAQFWVKGFLETSAKHIKSGLKKASMEEYKKIRLINANREQVDEEEQNTLDVGKNECAATAYAKMRAA